MANLVRPRSWGKISPPSGSSVDRGHPLAQGLVDVALLDRAGRPESVLYGPGRLGVPTSLTARGLRFPNGGAAEQVAWTLPTRTYSQITWAVLFTPTELGSAGAKDKAPLFSRGSTVGGIGTSNGADPTQVGYVWNDDPNTYNWQSGLVPVVGIEQLWVASVHPAYAVAQVRGVQATNTTPHAAVSWGDSAVIGRDTLDNSRLQGGYYRMAAVWNRALTREELLWLDAEPYAFFAPPGPKILYFALGTPPATPVTSTTIVTMRVGKRRAMAPRSHAIRTR